ncbi:MAG TPA: hypothetical protein VE035_19570, partial [Puia sp.]|nr:hypothetical protein [Puia sp.]
MILENNLFNAMTDKKTLLNKDMWDTIIIGGGQAGLATGYFLSRMNDDYVILDVSRGIPFTVTSTANTWPV